MERHLLVVYLDVVGVEHLVVTTERNDKEDGKFVVKTNMIEMQTKLTLL